MRREFPKSVKRDAFLRAAGKCEGEGCGSQLTVGKFHYDHDIPDAQGGEPTLENCKVLCTSCHSVKTRTLDVPAIAKTKRISDRAKGIKRLSRFPGSRDSIWKKKMNGSVVRR